MSTSQPPLPVAFRLKRPYGSEEEFLQGDGPAVWRTGMVLIGAGPRPEGLIVRFELALQDGTPLFRGEGRVVAHRMTPTDTHPPGLEIKFMRLDPKGKTMLERLLRQRHMALRPPSPGASGAPSDTPSDDMPPMSVPPMSMAPMSFPPLSMPPMSATGSDEIVSERALRPPPLPRISPHPDAPISEPPPSIEVHYSADASPMSVASTRAILADASEHEDAPEGTGASAHVGASARSETADRSDEPTLRTDVSGLRAPLATATIGTADDAAATTEGTSETSVPASPNVDEARHAATTDASEVMRADANLAGEREPDIRSESVRRDPSTPPRRPTRR